MGSEPTFTPGVRRLLDEARRANLATIAEDGRPRLVPVCFAAHPTAAILYSPLDEKPKRVADPRDLARVRDIAIDPRVTVLVDRWDEAWSRLAWVRCTGVASLLEPDDAGTPEHEAAVALLRDRYPQYAGHDLATRPVIRIAVSRVSSWGDV